MKKWGMTILAAALCVVGLVSTAVSQTAQTRDKLWFTEPEVQATVVMSDAWEIPHFMNRGENGVYLYENEASQGYSGMSAYKVATLIGLSGTNYAKADNIAIAQNGSHLYSRNKGGAILDKLGLAVSGHSGSDAIRYEVLKMTSDVWTDGTTTNWEAGVTAFPLDRGAGNTYISDSLDFNADSTALFGNSRSGTQNRIIRYTRDTLTGASNTLLVDQTFDSSYISRYRNLSCYKIGTNEFVFGGCGSSGSYVTAINVNDEDSANWTEQVVLNDDNIAGEISNVKISGIGTERMYLYVAVQNGTLAIYKLSHSESDGILTATFVKKFLLDDVITFANMKPGDTLDNGDFFRNFEVTDDGLYAFFIGAANKEPHAGGYNYLTVVSTPNQTIETEKLWFNNPARKSLTTTGWRSSSENSHYMDKGADDKYFVMNAAADGDGALYAFDMAKLVALKGTKDYSEVDACIGYVSGFSTIFGQNIRSKGVGVHDGLGYAITGRGRVDRTDYYAGYSLSLDGVVGSGGTTFIFGETGFYFNDPSTPVSDKVEFSLDGTCVYMNQYNSGNRSALTRFTYDALYNASGSNNLVVADTVITSSSRIRSMDIYELGGREVLFYGEGSKGETTAGSVWYRNISNNSWGQEQLLFQDSAIADNIMGVKVSGAGYEKYLYVFLDTTAELRIYELKVWTDGSMTATYEKSLYKADIIDLAGYPTGSTKFDNLRTFEVSNSGEYGFLAKVSQSSYEQQALAVIHTPQPIAITTTALGNKGTITVPDPCFASSAITVTPNSGYVIAQVVTNGVAVAGALNQTTLTLAFDADTTITASFAKTNAWWVNAGVFKKVTKTDGFFDGSENMSQFGISEEKGYLAASRAPGGSSSQAVMCQLADLNAATPTTPAYVSKSVNNGIYFGEPAKMANRSVTFVGDYLVGGNIIGTADWSLSYQLPAGGVPYTWQDAANGVVQMTASDGVGLCFMWQAPDGSVYASTYKGTKLGRYTLAGTTLTLDTTWGASGYVTLNNGSYGVVGAVIDGRTLVYVCTGSTGVFVVDVAAATPEATLLLSRDVTGRTQNLRHSVA